MVRMFWDLLGLLNIKMVHEVVSSALLVKCGRIQVSGNKILWLAIPSVALFASYVGHLRFT